MKPKLPFVPDPQEIEYLKTLIKHGDAVAVAQYNVNKAQSARNLKVFVVAVDADGKPSVRNICRAVSEVMPVEYEGDSSIRYHGGGMDMSYAFVCRLSKVLFGDETSILLSYV